MNILALDTSALTASVAVTRDNAVIYEKNVTSALTHSETLMPMIDDALKSVSIALSDVDLFAVSNGPGSFTGVRIGVSAVKGMAYALSKKVCGVNTLLSLAHNLAYLEDVPIYPIMDARRSQVYNAVYKFKNGKAEEMIPPRALAVEEMCAEISSPVIFTGDGVPAYREKISSLIPSYARFAPPNAIFQRAASCAVAALSLPEAYTFAQNLEVVYLRKCQAERERDERLKEKEE